MRRRFAIIGLLVLAAGIALLGWWLMPIQRVTAENAERIQRGMTLAEVEELLGASGDDPFDRGDPGEEGYDGVRIWRGGGKMLAVGFHAGRVRQKLFRESTLRERLEDWYHGRDGQREIARTVMILCS